MGSQISVDSSPIEISKIGHIKSQFDQKNTERHTFSSNIKGWCVFSNKNETKIKSIDFSNFIGFDKKQCYIILHIFHSKFQKEKQQKVDENITKGKSLFKLAISTTETLSPRGLEHHFSVNDLMLFETQQKSSLLYDLYLWHGKESSPITKATAITKSFEIERYLLGFGVLEQLFEMGNPVPITKYFDDDIIPLKAKAKPNNLSVSVYMSLYQRSHLFRTLVDSVTPSPNLEDYKGGKFHENHLP